MKYRYLAGACAARTGDEMSGPALLLLGFAVTRAPGTGSLLMSALTLAAAAGGPVFGALLDRHHHSERILAASLVVYATGIAAAGAGLGRIPLPLLAVLTAITGLAGPAVAGGWTSQVPGVVTPGELGRFSALDAMTFGAASLTGPALAAAVAAGLGARPAVITAAGLVALAVPAAWSLPASPGSADPARAAPLRQQVTAGAAAIVRNKDLGRATATSVISYAGVGMLLVACPLLGQQRLGSASRGALLISAAAAASLLANAVLARRAPREPGTLVLASTLLMAASLALAAVAPGWLTLPAVALNGLGEGPQLTGLLAIRHAEAPPRLRAQVFTTAASLKIGGLAAGTALAGPLAARSVTACLLTGAGIQLAAAAAYLTRSRTAAA